jgi:hypothetical protein
MAHATTNSLADAGPFFDAVPCFIHKEDEMKAPQLLVQTIAISAVLLLPGMTSAQTPTAKLSYDGPVKLATDGPVKPAATEVKTATDSINSSGKNRQQPNQNCSNDPKAKNFDPYCDLNRTMR